MKKNIKNPRKIKLNAEMIKALNTPDLAHIVGGGYVSFTTWCVK